MARARLTVRGVALTLALLIAIAGIYRTIVHLAEVGPESGTDRLLLPLLSIAVVVMALGLAGVLIRNLVRLIMDRKRGILGARLRTKLVFFFLALVLPPALVLFYGSAAVIRMTVEAMLRTPVQDLSQQARDIVDDWTDFLLGQCTRQARSLAGEIEQGGFLDPGRRRDLEALLARWKNRESLQLVVVSSGAKPIAWASDAEIPGGAVDAEDLLRLSSPLVERTSATGKTTTRIDYLRDGLLAHAVAPIGPAAGDVAKLPGGAAVAVGIYLPSNLASRMERITKAGDAYGQLRLQRRELVRLYLSLIALIFLVTVVVATWMGFYLSRRITGPIEELAGATREISAGNLGVRVRTEVGDEIGRLVASFNEMAAQLQESREVISRSTADLRRSNQALDDRRRYIETLVENLSTAVISVDRQGRVTTANPATEKILGVWPAPGEAVVSSLDRAGLEPLRDLLDPAAFAGGKSVREDLVLSRRGVPISVSVQVTPLHGGNSEPMGSLLMVEDLTDLLRAQRTAAWREVARRIAHEIKNPLTPIQLAAQRIRKKFEERSPDLAEVLPESTASIEREVDALKRMVDEFSRFARMPEMAAQPVEFGEVVRSVLALYQGLPDIRWEVDTASDVGTVKLDAEQMRRVFINLIDNAVTAMNGRGTIQISARAHTGHGSLHIEVADTGPGIPPADRDKMFAPYFSTKRRGTGLGLAIVHRVVTDHRGTIRVEENDPHGARFVIEIPA